MEGSEKSAEERETKRRREPENLSEKMDHLMEMIEERMDRFDKMMTDWRMKNEEMQVAIATVQKQQEEDKKERAKEREKEQEREQRLQRQIKLLEEKIDEQENRSRRVNLVVKGIEEEKGETWAQAEQKVLDLLETKLGLQGIEVVRAQRVGWQRGERPRPIVMKFGKEKQREQVLQGKNKLKNTEIYIDEDFSAKLRAERRQLFEVASSERAHRRKAVVRFNKVLIDGQSYRWCAERCQLTAVEGERQKNWEKRGN